MAKFTGQSWKKFLQTRNCFFEFLQIAIEMKWMCFCHFWKCGHKQSQGKIIFYRANSRNPYKTLWNFNIKKYTLHTPPMFSYDSWKTLQGKVQGVTGQKSFYRAKLIWPPMFSYDSWKSHFSQIIVFLRVNFKIGKIYRAKLKKISANTKLFFWVFANCNWNECNFVIFENVAIFHSLTPDVSLCPIAWKITFLSICVGGYIGALSN